MSMRLVRVNRETCRQGDGWGIADPETGEYYVKWLRELVIHNPVFYVSQVLRSQALKSPDKILHGWVEGYWEEGELPEGGSNQYRLVRYNPAFNTTFITDDDQATIWDAPRALFYVHGVYIDH